MTFKREVSLAGVKVGAEDAVTVAGIDVGVNVIGDNLGALKVNRGLDEKEEAVVAAPWVVYG